MARGKDLGQALENFARALEAATKKIEKASSGGPAGTAGGGGALGKILPAGKASGFGQGFGQGIGADALKARVAGAGGVSGFAGQIAGRAALGGVAALGVGVAAVGANLASAGINAAAKGQDISAGVAFAGDKLAAAIPYFGEAANKRVVTTEGVTSDLNALTNNLARAGFSFSDELLGQVAAQKRGENERLYDDQNRNADLARRQIENDTIIGALGRDLHSTFGRAGRHGVK